MSNTQPQTETRGAGLEARPDLTKKTTDITLTGHIEYDPPTFTITIDSDELHRRLKDGESLQDIAEELAWDSDYSEVESDPYYSALVIEGVEAHP